MLPARKSRGLAEVCDRDGVANKRLVIADRLSIGRFCFVGALAGRACYGLADFVCAQIFSSDARIRVPRPWGDAKCREWFLFWVEPIVKGLEMKTKKKEVTYCVVLVPTEEVVLAGVKASEAAAWCNTYNQVMLGHDVQAEMRVERKKLGHGLGIFRPRRLVRLAG